MQNCWLHSFFFVHLFSSLRFDSNRLLMRFFFNWKRLCSLFLLLLPLYFCWLPYFVNGFFCIVNRMAEASLEVMTSFMHLDNNYFYERKIDTYMLGHWELVEDKNKIVLHFQRNGEAIGQKLFHLNFMLLKKSRPSFDCEWKSKSRVFLIIIIS